MLELFGERADHALGIDRSSEMLRLARAKLSEHAVAADLRQADLYAPAARRRRRRCRDPPPRTAFAQQPGAAIAEAARVLGDGGRLLIADFAPHDREELRLRDAHTRLGFSDAQIGAWFANARLELDRVETLEGGKLTVKLWLGVKQPQRRLKEVA